MTQYYVSPTGLDTNPGSQAQPFQTIGHAASVVVAGDTVNVGAGIYPESFIAAANGTANAPITFISTSKWGAKITNPSATFATVNLEGTFTKFSGFDITNPTNQCAVKFFSGAGGSIVNNCLIHDVATSVVATAGAIICDIALTSGVTVDSNVIHNVGNPGNGNNMHAVYMTSPLTGGVGIGKITNNIISNVRSGCGVQLWGSPQGWDVENNTIFNINDNGCGGVVIGPSQVGFTCTNNRIQNNIFYGCLNKVISANGGGAFGTNLVEFNCDFNCTHDYSFALDGSVTVSNNLVNTDPSFSNYQANGTGNYHIQSNSSCIDAGTSVGAPPYDYDGYPRPINAGYDIGAYEFHSAIRIITYRSTVLGNNPIRYYRLNEVSGTTAFDLGSQGQNGTINGGITLSQKGLINFDSDTCMLFDGSTGYISLPTTGLPALALAVTLEVWVKYNAVPSNYKVIIELGTDSANNAIVLQNNASGNIEVAVNGVVEVVNPGTIVAGMPYHCVATYDGNVLMLYINGRNVASSTIGAIAVTYGSTHIGMNANFSASSAFADFIDEPAIYDHVLTNAQIANNYWAGINGGNGIIAVSPRRRENRER